jgi:hypothetical protein
MAYLIDSSTICIDQYLKCFQICGLIQFNHVAVDDMNVLVFLYTNYTCFTQFYDDMTE